jgi:type IV pilus assembly protein PilC
MSNTLTYSYKGRDTAGKVVKGKLNAPSEAAAITRMRTMGLAPIEVVAGGGSGLNTELSLAGFEKQVGLKDLAIMSRQLATMVGSGLSLLRALTILADQTENKKLARTLGIVRTQVETGAAFSEALARHHETFPPLMIHLVRAGEVGGFLEQALESVADTFEKDVKLMSTIKSAMSYPLVVLAMAIIGVVGMIVFIVPVFKKMFEDLGGDLPIPTQILVTLSENAIWAIPLVGILAVAFVFWWRKNKNTDKVRSFVDPLKLKLPVFGPLFQKVAIARVTRNLGTMTRSGVPILQALAIVADTSNNWVLQRALHEVQDSVRSGRSIAAPLSEHPVFPAMVVQMISVGEDSGALEQMLGKIADFYDDEVQTTTEALTSLIEPLMIAVIGVLIGGIIVSLYLPMFSLYDQIGQ